MSVVLKNWERTGWRSTQSTRNLAFWPNSQECVRRVCPILHRAIITSSFRMGLYACLIMLTGRNMFIFAKPHDDSNGHVWHHNIMASVNLADIKNIPIQVKDGYTCIRHGKIIFHVIRLTKESDLLPNIEFIIDTGCWFIFKGGLSLQIINLHIHLFSIVTNYLWNKLWIMWNI